MAEDYYDHEDDAPESRGGGHLFLWTVFILLLLGIAFGCWLGSFYIVGRPEQPAAYKILKKLNKIEPPKRFGITQAPQGDFLSPKRLFERYANKRPLELQEENDILMRAYIKNYKETKKLVPYVTGNYEIIASMELRATDFFPAGAVAVAVAVGDDVPPVMIQHVFTTGPEDSAKMRQRLEVGQGFQLEKTNDLAAVVHVAQSNGYLVFTCMPLTYGTYGKVDPDDRGGSQFSLQPPPDLNLAAGLPIIRSADEKKGLEMYTARRRARPVDVAEDEAARKPSLVRVETMKPGAAVPETGALPEVQVATPIPVAGGPTPRLPAATPFIVASKGPVTPRPLVVGAPTPFMVASAATPLPLPGATPPKVGVGGVQLKPFLAAMPALSGATGTSWPTYQVGKQPPGKTLNTGELSQLAERNELRGQIYLQGEFIVSASGNGRAVLRTKEKPGSPSARVIVDYPASLQPPMEAADIARGETRGFEVQKVERGPNGQLNIWAREIVEP